MKRFLITSMIIISLCGLAYGDVSEETGDTRTVPCTLYGKQADGTITAMLVDSDGKLDVGGSSVGGLWGYDTTDAIGPLTASDNVSVGGNLSVQGTTALQAVTATTLNTGQGAYELYAMNQDVQTTDSPTFAQLTLSNHLTVDGHVHADAFYGDISGTTGTVANATEAAGVALGYEASDTSCYPLFAETTSSPTSASYNSSFIFNSSSKALGCADLNLTDDLSVQDDMLIYGTITCHDVSSDSDVTISNKFYVDGGTLAVDPDVDLVS